MAWTDWMANLFRYKPKPDYWETLYRAEKVRADEVLEKLIRCQTDSSRIQTDLTLAIDQIKKLNASVTSLDRRNQALQGQLMVADNKDNSLMQNLLAKEEELLVSTDKINSLRVAITSLQSDLAKALGLDHTFTPEKLITLLRTQILTPELWDKYDSALVEVFALTHEDDEKTLTASEFLTILAKAFPEAKFISEPLDNLYNAPSCDFIEKAIRNDFGNLKSYVPEQRDCDDFAEDLRVHFRKVYGYNIGVIVLGDSPFGYHAWLLLVGYDGIVMAEPQTDSMTRIPDFLPGYVVRKFHTY